MMNINPKNYVSNTFLSEKELLEKLEVLRKQGKKIGLCTGSFDLLHPGHITHFDSAKKMCDILVVGVAKDYFSSQKRHANGRPVFSQNIRAFAVSKIKPVDFVFLDDGLPEVLNIIKPDFYIKGPDHKMNPDPRIEKIIEDSKGRIQMRYTQDEKLATNDIIKHIKEEIE